MGRAEATARQEACTLFGCGLEDESVEEGEIVASSEDTAEESLAVAELCGSASSGLPAAPAVPEAPRMCLSQSDTGYAKEFYLRHASQGQMVRSGVSSVKRVWIQWIT